MVKIKMDIFVKKYQPELYDFWRLGIDNTCIESIDNSSRRRQMAANNSSNTVLAASPQQPPFSRPPQLKVQRYQNHQQLQSYLSKIADHYSYIMMDDLLENNSIKSLDLSVFSILPDYLAYSLSRSFTKLPAKQRGKKISLATLSSRVAVDLLKRVDSISTAVTPAPSRSRELDVVNLATESSQDESQPESEETAVAASASSPIGIADLVDSVYARSEDSEETKSVVSGFSAQASQAEFVKSVQFQNLKCDTCKLLVRFAIKKFFSFN
jgi:hypothetical protein